MGKKGLPVNDGKVLKIIVPVQGSPEQAAQQARAATAAGADVIEWRADLPGHEQVEAAKGAGIPTPGTIAKLRQATPLPILGTVRSVSEGGTCAASSYDQAVRAVLEEGVDALDVETARLMAPDLVAAAKWRGIKVVGSFHDFQGTPTVDNMQEILRRQVYLGVDIAKIAVMPRTPADVIALLQVVTWARQQLPVPVIGISMSELGKISRLWPPALGNYATFASVGEVSAPGQFEISAILPLLRHFTADFVGK
ncbi:MAG: type I 3-dehydroquinate dehydratase [Actinomycetaceae bacterium]|nr:type I 3-dehydroquinate dehydratase [Actinomycetaceae bacterium]